MLTGRVPARTGVYDWVPPNTPMCLPTVETAIPTILKSCNYHTGHFGKWHLSRWTTDHDMLGPLPSDHGYDYWFGCDNNAVPTHHNPTNYYRNGEKTGPLEGYACDLVVSDAIDWLKRLRNSAKRDDTPQPFFMTVWYNEPHVQLGTPPDLVRKYVDKGFPQREAEYLGNVENLDRATGKLLDALDTMGYRDNTLVLFTSDNGPQLFDRSRGPLRAKKGSIYDGGIREPGIFRFPGKIGAGTTCIQPSGFVDLLPTVCDLAGAELPKSRPLDGVSIVSLLEGKSNTVARQRPLCWYFYKSDPLFAIRDGDYKLCATTKPLFRSPSHPFDQTDLDFLKTAELNQFALYNLRKDIAETTDLRETEPEVFRRLQPILLEMYREIIAEGPRWEGLPPQ